MHVLVLRGVPLLGDSLGIAPTVPERDAHGFPVLAPATVVFLQAHDPRRRGGACLAAVIGRTHRGRGP